MFWFIVLGLVGISSIAGLIYMVWSVGQFPGIIALADGNKALGVIIPAAIVIGLFAVCVLTMSFMNAAVVFIHFAMFRLMFGLAGRIVRHFAAGTGGSRFYWQGLGALIVSVVYLAIAFILCRHVWLKTYDIETRKPVGNIKAAMFADSHIGTTFDGDGFAMQMEKISAQNPDILFIVGDFVDDETKTEDMVRACEALGKMDIPYGIWYVFGNHDRGYYRNAERGFTEEGLIKELLKNGVHVMRDDVEIIEDKIAVVGRYDKSFGNRKPVAELVDDIGDDKYIIVLDHQPADYDDEAATKADLVLSGHTHGGQLIPITYVGKWLGQLDKVYGHEQINGTDFIVTSGISDWALAFKTGTRSEYVIINISGN